MNAHTGKVTLLSAGPGDLDLLTRKAVKALAAADVVLLDDLANPGIVTLAAQARVIRVGKRGGCRSTPQTFIERLMRRYALKGLHVVWVKGGDALLFGRAGEEIAILRDAGIAVDIINGISSDFASAALSRRHFRYRPYRGSWGAGLGRARGNPHDPRDLYGHAADWQHRGGVTREPARLPAGSHRAVGGRRAGTASRDRLAVDATDAGFGSPAVILVGNAIGEMLEARWTRLDDVSTPTLAADIADDGEIACAA